MSVLDDYRIHFLKPLGQGAYGTVYKAQHKESGEYVAAKRVILSNVDFDRKLQTLETEIAVLQEMGDQHKNIVKFIKTQRDGDRHRMYVWILTEYCSLMDLEIYSKKHNLATGHHVDIMRQVASGLAFMHAQKPPVIHRDVKPSNILMTEDEGKHVVRLADFGLARYLDPERSKQTMTVGGTPTYMAPELFDEKDHWPKDFTQHHRSGAQDSYSYGISCYQLLQAEPGTALICPEVTGTSIGRNLLSARQAMRSLEPIVILKTDSDAVKRVKELIKSVVCFDPKERNTMLEMEKALEEVRKMVPYPGLPAPFDTTAKP